MSHSALRFPLPNGVHPNYALVHGQNQIVLRCCRLLERAHSIQMLISAPRDDTEWNGKTSGRPAFRAYGTGSCLVRLFPGKPTLWNGGEKRPTSRFFASSRGSFSARLLCNRNGCSPSTAASSNRGAADFCHGVETNFSSFIITLPSPTETMCHGELATDRPTMRMCSERSC